MIMLRFHDIKYKVAIFINPEKISAVAPGYDKTKGKDYSCVYFGDFVLEVTEDLWTVMLNLSDAGVAVPDFDEDRTTGKPIRLKRRPLL